MCSCSRTSLSQNRLHDSRVRCAHTGFGPMLLENGPALRRFQRQILTNGIPVVFAVNYLSFFLYAVSAKRQGTLSSPILIVDLPSRICVNVVLHGVIYFVSADWFGSFGGDRWVSLACSRPDPRTISGVREHFRSLPLRNNDQRGTAVSKRDLGASCRDGRMYRIAGDDRAIRRITFPLIG